MTDLETAIRDALHSRADEVVLRESSIRPRRPRWLLPSVAAAVLLAVVTVAVVLQHRGDAAKQPAIGTAPTFVGHRWQLDRIDVRTTHVGSASQFHAFIGFARDGSLQANDSVNDCSGSYRVTAAGYTIDGDMACSAAGYAGKDVLRFAVIEGIGDLINVDTEVDVRVSGNELTMTIPSASVIAHFTRAGVQPNEPPPGTQTSTP